MLDKNVEFCRAGLGLGWPRAPSPEKLLGDAEEGGGCSLPLEDVLYSRSSLPLCPVSVTVTPRVSSDRVSPQRGEQTLNHLQLAER